MSKSELKCDSCGSPVRRVGQQNDICVCDNCGQIKFLEKEDKSAKVKEERIAQNRYFQGSKKTPNTNKKTATTQAKNINFLNDPLFNEYLQKLQEKVENKYKTTKDENPPNDQPKDFMYASQKVPANTFPGMIALACIILAIAIIPLFIVQSFGMLFFTIEVAATAATVFALRASWLKLIKRINQVEQITICELMDEFDRDYNNEKQKKLFIKKIKLFIQNNQLTFYEYRDELLLKIEEEEK